MTWLKPGLEEKLYWFDIFGKDKWHNLSSCFHRDVFLEMSSYLLFKLDSVLR